MQTTLRLCVLLLVAMVFAPLAPETTHAAREARAAWFSCRLVTTPSGMVVKRYCWTHAMPRHRTERPIGWSITRTQLNRTLFRSVRYPKFAPPPPPPVPVVDMSATVRPYVGQWSSEIAYASQRTGVPTRVIAAVMMVETRGVHTCTSGDGLSSGLMQLIPSTAASVMGVSIGYAIYHLCYDPFWDVLTGATYLLMQYRTFGYSWPNAAGAYNGGSYIVPGYVARFLSYYY